MAPTIDALLREARRRLSKAPFDPSLREAALLLGHVLGLGEAQILARGDLVPDPDSRDSFLALLERRLTGEPVAYLVGEREFYGRSFVVDSRVLVPRPETEHLVEAVLELDLPAAPRILDLGTGSGCLATTLALELPKAQVVAVDRSPGAVAVTRVNARGHGVLERVRPVVADLAQPLDLGRFDLVVSNPPYIDPSDAPDISQEITRFEPGLALFAPEAGFGVIRRLMDELGALRPGTHLLIEIGKTQDLLLKECAESSGFDIRALRPDYAGIPRVVHLTRRIAK